MPAGLVDAGLASLTSFAVGLYAARQLEPAVLGAYALFFSAFTVLAVIPTQLILVPAEAASIAEPGDLRLALVPRSLMYATPIAALAAATMLLVVLVVPDDVPTSAAVKLAATGVVAALFSPLQDHVRRMFHFGDESWRAALVSAIQFVVAVLTIVVGQALSIPEIWVPFGALAVANLVSLASALLLARPWRRPEPKLTLRAWTLLGSGKWLLTVGLIPAAGSFFVAWIVAQLATLEELGFVEAARVVASPLFVLALGLSAVTGPRSMEAASSGDGTKANAIARMFALWMVVVSLLYGLVVGVDAPWNPAAHLIPNAYVVGGLVIATIAANMINGIVFPIRSELIGAHRELDLTKTEGGGNLGRGLVSLSAGAIGAFAAPLSFLVLGFVRLGGFLYARYSIYKGPEHRRPTRRVRKR